MRHSSLEPLIIGRRNDPAASYIESLRDGFSLYIDLDDAPPHKRQRVESGVGPGASLRLLPQVVQLVGLAPVVW